MLNHTHLLHSVTVQWRLGGREKVRQIPMAVPSAYRSHPVNMNTVRPDAVFRTFAYLM